MSGVPDSCATPAKMAAAISLSVWSSKRSTESS
jgi:hypothetical protein